MRQGIDVELREVGLRDGLQNVDTFFPTAAKIEWLKAEAAAGVPEIEACSFVPPKLLPQFTDCLEVLADALEIEGCEISALIPNLKGAERGVAAGVPVLNYVTSVSETHNMNNVRRTPAESVEDFARVVELVQSQPEGKRPRLAAGLATAFGCTLEGDIDPKAVVKIAELFVAAGCDEMSIADTVGYANPAQIKSVTKLVLDAIPDDMPLALHLHDTRGLGLANMAAGLEVGITRFDACLAGLGGCPWAPGASGNVIMEDAAFMLEAMGLRTGIDLDALVKVREIVETNLPDERLGGAFAQAGAPKGFRPASQLSAAAE